jgi:hypothetical protein
MAYLSQKLGLIMTTPAEVNSLSEQIPGKLCFHSCLVSSGVAGYTACRMIILPCNFIFMTLHAVRELLGKKGIMGKKDNEKGRDKNKGKVYCRDRNDFHKPKKILQTNPLKLESSYIKYSK